MPINSKFITVAMYLAILVFSCKSQVNLNWSSSISWKIYKTTDISSFKLDTNELKKFENILADSISYYLYSAKKTNEKPIWQDFFVTTCLINGKQRKVVFSIYGGFFYDAQSNQYYHVQPEHRKPLIEYIERKLFQ